MCLLLPPLPLLPVLLALPILLHYRHLLLVLLLVVVPLLRLPVHALWQRRLHGARLPCQLEVWGERWRGPWQLVGSQTALVSLPRLLRLLLLLLGLLPLLAMPRPLSLGRLLQRMKGSWLPGRT